MGTVYDMMREKEIVKTTDKDSLTLAYHQKTDSYFVIAFVDSNVWAVPRNWMI